MDEPTPNRGEHAHASPLHTLEHVPISFPYIEIMKQLLTAHGACLTETKDHRQADPPYTEFRITFPAGTVRSFGLVMLRSRYFDILFPDGFCLHGGELWPLQHREGETCVTILHLPRDSSGKKGQEDVQATNDEQ